MARKKTHEEFIEDVKRVHESKIRPLEEYINSQTKILFKCNVCGHEWRTVPASTVRGCGCPKCGIKKAANKQRKTNEEFIAEVRVIHNNKIKPLEAYVNNHTKLLFYCRVCGNEWRAEPNSVVNIKTGCPKCAGNKPPTNEEFIEMVKERFEGKIKPLGEYEGSQTKMVFKCNICDNEWEATPNVISRTTYGCPHCAAKQIAEKNAKTAKTNFQFLKDLKNVHGENIKLVGRYKNNHTKIMFKCETCNHEWQAVPNHILNKRGCPKCAGKIKLTNEEFVKRVRYVHGNKIKPLGKYKNNKAKLLLKCNDCGHEWKARPYNIIGNKSGCPECASNSKGEDEIKKYLDEQGINYEREYSFSDLKHKIRLRYDFAIFDGKELLGLIEFDGIQHFKPIDYFGGIEEFKITKKRDELKNDYCKAKGIPLLRIPYTDINVIGELIDGFLDSVDSDNQLSIF